MPGTLSHELAPLKVAGNRIVEAATGKPVMLRGVNRSGLEYSQLGAGITAEEIQEITGCWGANVVRLPFNQAWALGCPGYDPARYLETLDFVIDQAAARGAYTLLDLQWLDAVTGRGTTSDGCINFVAALPVLASGDLWRQLAARYAGESAVLYDVFNEPHDALPDDASELRGMREDGSTFPLESRRVSMAEWQPWARYLIAAIRGANPDALIFVSGVNWGYDLRGFPLEGVEGVVYSTHVYRNKGKRWAESFGRLAATHPVFAGEWGGGPKDVEWGERLAAYLVERGIGWTAWSWSDDPRLVDAGYVPSAFGCVVKNALGARREMT
jgi:aryl-phospho-beta-D-glucosidase BglC (GH1 family)